jgi:hypothetical protein
VILLGSIASGKYLDILSPIFGSRLRFPAEFIGLGDMSRGGLLLRCVKENSELKYSDAAALLDAAGKRDRTKKQSPGDLATAESSARLPVSTEQPSSFVPSPACGRGRG